MEIFALSVQTVLTLFLDQSVSSLSLHFVIYRCFDKKKKKNNNLLRVKNSLVSLILIGSHVKYRIYLSKL